MPNISRARSILNKKKTDVSILFVFQLLNTVIEKKEDKVLTIEGKIVPHEKENLLVKLDSDACPLCATGLDVKHTVSSITKVIYITRVICIIH